MKNRYKISELAKLANISKQTLIFYHKKDILVPEYIEKLMGIDTIPILKYGIYFLL